MNDLTDQRWFVWVVAIGVGLPIVLLVLTELHMSLARRRNAMASPVAMLRNYAVPAGVLLLLFTQAWDISAEATWIRLLATVFGFLLLVLALSALNVVLFSHASTGTWRDRMPTIFVDIARLILIVVGLAVIFAFIWGADVGGLFAALGVTSIVLGFALQNAVGSIVSGLLLLFEQPFQLGDWLDTGSVRGRVVEVNWRAIHIQTGSGMQIVPNATLAESSFTNLSQPAGVHTVVVSSVFASSDRPDAVRALLDRVASDLPALHLEVAPVTTMTGPATYATALSTRSPADAARVVSVFLSWTWYAAQRAGLHLDGYGPTAANATEIEAILRSVAGPLHLVEEDFSLLAHQCTRERWGAGEVIQHAGTVPTGLRFIVAGRVAIRVSDGERIVQAAELGTDDFFGQSTLTRQRTVSDDVALSEVTCLLVPQAVIDDLVRNRSRLARDLGRMIDLRRVQTRSALETAPPDSTPDLSSTSV